MGADVIGLGRLQCWALAAGGEAAVFRMLELLEAEVRQSMCLLGINTWAEADPALLQTAPATTTAHVFSAFPLLDVRSNDWFA